MAELMAGVTLFPQTLINVRLNAGQDWQASPGLQAATREVEAMLGANGRLLIRASGTEPLIRCYIEAKSATQLKKLEKACRALLLA
jgi:phosphoglucosamine mutase